MVVQVEVTFAVVEAVAVVVEWHWLGGESEHDATGCWPGAGGEGGVARTSRREVEAGRVGGTLARQTQVEAQGGTLGGAESDEEKQHLLADEVETDHKQG